MQHTFFDLIAVEQTPFDLLNYDTYIVMFSGGKDSIASYLALREAGVPNDKIELWHHEIDGREGSRLMDWPCTRSYCARFAATFEVPLYFSWREGGFERELLRQDAATAPVIFETPEGVAQAGGESHHRGTRLRFPQQSGNLSVRWCSSALKIDVAAAAIRNQERFQYQRTLVVTGERAEESAARACYASVEPHRTDRRRSQKLARHIDHYRPIHGWTEQEVWAILECWRINPHPAYRLGWGRVSCAGCIFGSVHQWASLKQVNPGQFAQIADYESQFGCAIRRDKRSIVAAAAEGKPYPSITTALIAEAGDAAWNGPIVLPPEQPWALPAGAFGDGAGPT
jgi:3'-phosphoadenosine 5'-phosphosulfate sulfotransferase (PAPS reductase)/FAD synthetase